jgi:hypothetical protein
MLMEPLRFLIRLCRANAVYAGSGDGYPYALNEASLLSTGVAVAAGSGGQHQPHQLSLGVSR